MKLSDRDKTLLFVLGIVAVLCLPYYFIVRPYTDKISVLESELIELKSRKSELDALMLRREEFETNTAAMKTEKEEILNRFPASLAQENMLLFLDHAEELLQIDLYQVSAGEEIPLAIGEQTGTDTVAEGEDTAPVNEDLQPDGEQTDSGQTEDQQNLTGLSTTLQINYNAGYENFKDFLAYILNNNERMVITELRADYAAETDQVDGNLMLVQYAAAGEGRIPKVVKEPDLGKGTSNVFLQAAGRADSSTGEADQTPADFFVMISQPKADVEAVIVGQSKDGSGKTYLTSEENKTKEVTVRFEGSEGKYKAVYMIGDKKYSEEGISFSKEEDIGLEILSSARVGEEDKVAVNLKLINKTDRKVLVSVKDDDKENKRVKISEKTGDITVN